MEHSKNVLWYRHCRYPFMPFLDPHCLPHNLYKNSIAASGHNAEYRVITMSTTHFAANFSQSQSLRIQSPIA